MKSPNPTTKKNMTIIIDENELNAKCIKCKRVMPKVNKGEADYCYDCEP